MVRWILIFTFLLIVWFPAKAQKPEVLFHFMQWKASEDKTLAEFRMFISNKGWKSNSTLNEKVTVLLLSSKGDTIGFERVNLHLPAGVPLSTETVLPYTFAQAVKPGNFELLLSVKDGVTNDSIFNRIPISIKSFAGDSIKVAQPMIVYAANRAQEASITTKSGYDIEIRPLNFFPQTEEFIQTYVEVYHPSKSKRPYWVRGGLANQSGIFYADFAFNKKADSAEATAIMRNMNIKDLPSGQYQFRYEAVDESGKTLSSAYTEFTRSNPPADHISITDNDGRTKLNLAGTFAESMTIEELRKYISALLPIATENEKRVLPMITANTDILGMRQFLLTFWQKRNAQDPNEAFQDYKKRLQYAQKNYNQATMNVFNTDRGRVLLQYGFPNQVENEINDRQRSASTSNNTIGYEIWYYYKTSKSNQSNVQFVFIQENRGNNNYRLIHSNANGEPVLPTWRTALQNNNSQGNNNFINQSGSR